MQTTTLLLFDFKIDSGGWCKDNLLWVCVTQSLLTPESQGPYFVSGAIWSLIVMNHWLLAGDTAWAGPNASILDGYRLHLLQGQPAEGTDWVKWGIFNFLDSGYNGSSLAAILQLETCKNSHGTKLWTQALPTFSTFLLRNYVVWANREPICERCFPISGFLSSCEPTFGWDKFLELWPAANTDWRRRLQWVFPINLPVKLRNKLGSGTKGQKEEEEKETEESKFWHPKLH